MSFGFNHQLDALNAKGASQRKMPVMPIGSETDKGRQSVFNANYVVKTPASGINPRVSDIPGKAVCTVQYIGPADDTLFDYPKYDGSGVLEIDVYNLGTAKVQGDKRITVWQVGEKFIYGSVGGGLDYPWIIVRVKCTDDLWGKNAAVVDWTTAANRSYEPFTLGVNEPTYIENPFAIDCVADGFIWIGRYQDSGGTGDDNWYVLHTEDRHARFIECDVFAGNRGAWNLSIVSWHDGVKPFDVDLWNDVADDLPLYLAPSLNNASANYDRVQMLYDNNDGRYRWDNDTKYQAKWVYGDWDVPPDSSPGLCITAVMTLRSICDTPGYFDGENPGPTVLVRFIPTISCSEPTNMRGWATYRREAGANRGEYIVMNTESAMMGPPTARNIGVGPGSFRCDVENGQWCLETEDTATVWGFECAKPLGEEPVPHEIVCVDSKEFLDCLGICEYICLYCEDYAAPEDCEDEKRCCGDCIFGSPYVVSLVIDDTANTGTIYTSTAEVTWIDDCTFEVLMDDESIATVTYQQADGTFLVEHNAVQYVISNGTCAGGSFTTGSTTVDLTMNGVPCGTQCCEDSWLENVTIQGFRSGVSGGAVEWAQDTGPVTRDGCEFTVPIIWKEQNGGENTGSGTATLTYDQDAGTWRVDTDPTSLSGADLWGGDLLGGFNVDPGTCCGLQSCPDLACMDEGTTTTSGVFEVINCIAPSALVATATMSAIGLPKFGDYFKMQNADLVRGCSSCKSGDVIRLMNSYGADKSIDEAARLAGQIKTSAFSAVDIKTRIVETAERYKGNG